jgi:hypothetical protein
MADVFRVFLQFAQAERSREFKSVELAFRGHPRFRIDGKYFKQLGEEFGTENPVYTMRTFPENLSRPDGSRAYPTWTGGWIGVAGKQMQDFNDFHRQWWMQDLLASTQGVSGGAPASNTPASDVSYSPVASTAVPVTQQQSSQGTERPSSKASPKASARAAKQPESSSNQPMQIPEWLGFPQVGITEYTAVPNHVHAAYDTNADSVSVVAGYETELHKAAWRGVRYDENGDQQGILFQAVERKTSCSLRLRHNGAATHVEVDCVLSTEAPTPVPAAPASGGQATLPAGVHLIEYKLDGSARTVGVTYRNPTGGTEQKDVALPAGMTFYAATGSFVYLSAQNQGDNGEVHVAVLVDGRLLQEATSSTAYGIATASGSVPR